MWTRQGDESSGLHWLGKVIAFKKSNSCSLNIKQRNTPSSKPRATNCPRVPPATVGGHPGVAPHPISPRFTHVASRRSSKRNGQNHPKPHRPVRKGKILIQSDCSFGNFLLLKEKHEQKPFSLGKETGKPSSDQKGKP